MDNPVDFNLRLLFYYVFEQQYMYAVKQVVLEIMRVAAVKFQNCSGQKI